MDESEQSNNITTASAGYLEEQISSIKDQLAYALSTSPSEIKVSFPTLKNFYYVNNVYKSAWAIYLDGKGKDKNDKLPKLLYTGNFLIQGDKFGNRSVRSPFGAKALSPLTSVANSFSYEASIFKQNWTLDLNLLEEDDTKLAFTVKEYQDFLKMLNLLRAQWLLHLSEEGNFDFVICELSEPSDQIFFIDLESFDSSATKIKTYFKPISERALMFFRKLASNTEFEGKFFNLQPGMWLRDDVIIELQKFYSEKFLDEIKNQFDLESITSGNEYVFNNPFKVHALEPLY